MTTRGCTLRTAAAWCSTGSAAEGLAQPWRTWLGFPGPKRLLRSGVFSQAGSDIAMSGEAQSVDRQDAQDGEVGRTGAGADLAVVLGEDDVSDQVQVGLDGPVPSDPGGQQRRVGGAGVEAGDGVGALHAPVPVPGARPASVAASPGGLSQRSRGVQYTSRAHAELCARLGVAR